MTKNQNESILLGVRIPPEEKEKLEAEAKRRHLTLNELVTEMLNGVHTGSGNPGDSEHASDAETEEKIALMREVVKQGVKEALAELEAEKAHSKAAEEEENKKKFPWF